MYKYGNVPLFQLQLSYESAAGVQSIRTTETYNVLISLTQLSTKFFGLFSKLLRLNIKKTRLTPNGPK